jgi:hypothetical protein
LVASDLCHETVRFCWNRFGPMFAAEIRRKRAQGMRQHTQWRWHLDEVYVKINGQMHYLWRAVDHEGEVLEVAPLGQQVLHVPQGQGVLHVHHHHETDYLWGAVEAAERAGRDALAGHGARPTQARLPGGAFGLTEPSGNMLPATAPASGR